MLDSEGELAQRRRALALQLRTGSAATAPPPPSSLDERITQALFAAGRPVPVTELRELCRVRNASLHERLTALTRSGHLLRDEQGYRLGRSNGVLAPSGTWLRGRQRAAQGSAASPLAQGCSGSSPADEPRLTAPTPNESASLARITSPFPLLTTANGNRNWERHPLSPHSDHCHKQAIGQCVAPIVTMLADEGSLHLPYPF